MQHTNLKMLIDAERLILKKKYFFIVNMVRVCIYFFGPQGNLDYNNSSLILETKVDICRDIQAYELSPIWKEARPSVLETYKNFDLIVGIGESDRLKDSAKIEMEAKKSKTVRNRNSFPVLGYVKINNKYDPLNDYTCNDLNYFLLKSGIKSVFIHVPTNKSVNSKIRNDIMQIIDHMSVGIRKHSIQAKREKNVHVGYTGIRREDTHCDRGIFFAFEKKDTHEMTMKNTPMDLDIIFMNEKMKIVSIQEGHKNSGLYSHRSFNVLEMPGGYCETNFVNENDKIEQILLF